jgi:hypothetical protein
VAGFTIGFGLTASFTEEIETDLKFKLFCHEVLALPNLVQFLFLALRRN